MNEQKKQTKKKTYEGPTDMGNGKGTDYGSGHGGSWVEEGEGRKVGEL